MKRSRFHIVHAWALLICFIAGQTIVFVHQHSKARAIVNAHSRTVVTENCQLCDAMHHNSMMQVSDTYFTPFTITQHFYKQGQYDFVSIALILSAGRAPPQIS